MCVFNSESVVFGCDQNWIVNALESLEKLQGHTDRF